MNFLYPHIEIIGNRRYRKNPSGLDYQDSFSTNEPYNEETEDMFIEINNDDLKDESTDQINNKSYCNHIRDIKDIEKIGQNTYKQTILVHDIYFGFIIGRNAEKKMKLERETRTRIKIPKRGNNDWIVIEGTNKQDIVSCKNRINLLIIEARHRTDFTHLITFPLIFDSLKDRFIQFQKEVLSKCGDDRGVDESIFQYPNKIHLTICTAILLNDTEIEHASMIMEDYKRTHIISLTGSKPLKINIKGLEYMNDDPSQVDVLYAKVNQINEENSIQIIADDLMRKFCEAGLTKKQYDSVKLHATVMNTLKRQDYNCNYNQTEKAQRESFNAINILKNFESYDFGIYNLNEIHLSLRYSSAPNGYYECIKRINIS